jgi:biopolymer transport protein ExbB
VLPVNLAVQVKEWVHNDQLDPEHLQRLHESSPLGQMLATGLSNRHAPRELIKESIEDVGRHSVHELERYLNALGTIAAISPLMGLLGTVIGMIKVFAAITTSGVGNPGVLAGGISEALITTAAGLCVAIPALIGYRYLRARVDALVVQMEKETIKFLETVVAYQNATEAEALSGELAEAVKRRA